MNEQDYIDATNLAKARIAQDITGSILTTTNAEHKNRMAALSALGKIIERLEKKTWRAMPPVSANHYGID